VELSIFKQLSLHRYSELIHESVCLISFNHPCLALIIIVWILYRFWISHVHYYIVELFLLQCMKSKMFFFTFMFCFCEIYRLHDKLSIFLGIKILPILMSYGLDGMKEYNVSWPLAINLNMKITTNYSRTNDSILQTIDIMSLRNTKNFV